MNIIFKKSLSVIFALLMALTSLTIGTASAFAQSKSDYKAINSGQTKVTNEYLLFTPERTGYYDIILSDKKDNVEQSNGFMVKKANDYNENSFTKVDSGDSRREKIYSVDANKNLVSKVQYFPAFTTTKLYAGEPYYIELDSFDSNDLTTLTVKSAEFTYNYSNIYSDLTYNSNGKLITGSYITGMAVRINKYLGTSTEVVIPSSLNGFPVNDVNFDASEVMKKRITSVKISEGIETIDGFNYMYSLKQISLPSTLKSILSGAFTGDHALTGSITIPAGVTSIGKRAFYDTSLTSVRILNAKAIIGDYAFGYKLALNEATPDPTDTITVKVSDFFIIAPKNSTAQFYAENNGFKSYDYADCQAGNHPYKATTIAATVFANGKETKICPVCNSTVVKTLKKKTFKISSVKSSRKKSIVVKAPAQKQMKGYQIQYSTSKSFSKKSTKTVKIATTKNLNKTIKGLKSGKKYYVRVRAYKTSGKKTVYSSYTAVKTVKVK